MKHRIYRSIKTPKDLANAYLGNPNTAIVPPKHPIDRTAYGCRLAKAEGGRFTPLGYIVPTKKRSVYHAT